MSLVTNTHLTRGAEQLRGIPLDPPAAFGSTEVGDLPSGLRCNPFGLFAKGIVGANELLVANAIQNALGSNLILADRGDRNLFLLELAERFELRIFQHCSLCCRPFVVAVRKVALRRRTRQILEKRNRIGFIGRVLRDAATRDIHVRAGP